MSENEAVQPFIVEDAMTVINSEPEQIPSLVQDLFLRVGVSMVVGKPKVGKSTLARQLAVAVAEGRAFLGHDVLSGDVLYFVLEGPKGVVAHHLKKLGYTGTKGTVLLVHERMPYEGEMGLRKLEATLAQNKQIVLVIIDPVVKFLRMQDSDRNDIVSDAIERLESVAKKFGLHVQMLAHAKKKMSDDVGDSPLGSTGFRGGTDTNLFLVKVGSDRVLSTEQRWGTGMEPTIVMFDEERGEMTLGQTIEKLEELAEQRKEKKTRDRIEGDIMAAIAELRTPTQAEVLGKVKGKTAVKLEVLASMVERGLLLRTGEGTKGEPTRYHFNLPESGQQDGEPEGTIQPGITESFMQRFGK